VQLVFFAAKYANFHEKEKKNSRLIFATAPNGETTRRLKKRFIGNRRGVPPDVGRIANPTYAAHHIWRSITANPREPKKSAKSAQSADDTFPK
jgi:hypothetical protein